MLALAGAGVAPASRLRTGCGMTLSRRVFPGQVHLVTRHVAEGLLLRPGAFTSAVMRYALAVAASETGVVVLTAFFGSTHYHLVVHDPTGKLDQFMCRLNSLSARALNSYLGRRGAFWEPVKYSNVELHDKETIIEKMLYVLLNPVQDGLVENPGEWPGVIALPEHFGTSWSVEKPESAFFGGRRRADYEPGFARARDESRAMKRAEEERDAQLRDQLARQGKAFSPHSDKRRRHRAMTSTLPDSLDLEFGIPPGFEDLGAGGFRDLLRERLAQRLATVHARRKAQGLRSYLGAQAIQRPDPRSPYRSSGLAQFKLDPRLACVDPAARRSLLQDLADWRAKYRTALALFTSRDQSDRASATFPYGTIRRRVLSGARVSRRPRGLHAALRS